MGQLRVMILNLTDVFCFIYLLMIKGVGELHDKITSQRLAIAGPMRQLDLIKR